MASPGASFFQGQFIGVAADVTITKVPFRPKTVKFWTVTGGHIEHGYKSDAMSGSAYLSTTTGIDAGVTLSTSGFVVANGADVNVAAATVYYEVVG